MPFKTSCFEVLNRIIPKNNYILFDSYPNICDNSYELYRYIIHERRDLLDKYHLYWAKKGELDTNSLELDSNTIIIDKKSVKGIWIFLRSKYVVSTHGYFRYVKSGKGQIQVNLWHGCGYKTLTPKDKGYRGEMTIVTSSIYQKPFSELFDLEERNVFVTGYPRNDRLFQKNNILDKIGIDRNIFSKILLWMPTYRRASLGHEGVDGTENSLVASNLSLIQYKKLNDHLKNLNYFLIIKPHPMDALKIQELEKMSNIVCLTTNDLQKIGVELYDLLSNTDLLLSDYSSVVVDYLLLDKPIVMVLSDIKEYRNSRGFLFEPVERYFPGPIVSSFDDLLKYLDDMDLINEQWSSQRNKIKCIMHTFFDNRSSERVANIIWGEKT